MSDSHDPWGGAEPHDRFRRWAIRGDWTEAECWALKVGAGLVSGGAVGLLFAAVIAGTAPAVGSFADKAAWAVLQLGAAILVIQGALHRVQKQQLGPVISDAEQTLRDAAQLAIAPDRLVKGLSDLVHDKPIDRNAAFNDHSELTTRNKQIIESAVASLDLARMNSPRVRRLIEAIRKTNELESAVLLQLAHTAFQEPVGDWWRSEMKSLLAELVDCYDRPEISGLIANRPSTRAARRAALSYLAMIDPAP